MKHVKKFENINFEDISEEEFDNNISNWTIIKKGTILPDDFVINKGNLNRHKYIIEMGWSNENSWKDEFSVSPTAEIIGSIIIGSKIYNDFRYRLRKDSDEIWDLKKTTISKIINNSGRY